MVRRVETITLRHVHIASSLLLGCLIHPFLTLFPGTGKAGSSKSRVRHAKNGFFSGLKDADFLKYDGAWPPPAERVLPFQHGMVGPFPLVPHGIEPSSRVSASPGRSGSTVGQFCPRCRANHPVNILPVRFRGDCLGSLQAQIRARSETQIEDEFRPIFGNRFFSIQGYHSVEPKSCSQATLEYPRDRKEVVLKDTHDDIGRHMQNPRSKCMRMSSRISTRTFGNHFPAPRSVRPKVAAISGIAFPNLLTPEFAGLRANDDRRAFFRLLAKEHLAKSCAQLVNLTSCGRLHVFPVPLHFAHGSMPGSVLRSGIIGIGRHTLKW